MVSAGVEEGDVRDNVGVGVVVCSVFNADRVVINVVNMSVECVFGVNGKLHDVISIAEGVEPVVCSMTMIFVVAF